MKVHLLGIDIVRPSLLQKRILSIYHKKVKTMKNPVVSVVIGDKQVRTTVRSGA